VTQDPYVAVDHALRVAAVGVAWVAVLVLAVFAVWVGTILWRFRDDPGSFFRGLWESATWIWESLVRWWRRA